MSNHLPALRDVALQGPDRAQTLSDPWSSNAKRNTGVAAGMAKESRSTTGEGDKIIALDWLGFAERRVLGDVLRLFSLRIAWLKEGDQKAHMELARACRAANPHIREVAELLLSEMAFQKQPYRSTGASQDRSLNVQSTGPKPRPVTLTD